MNIEEQILDLVEEINPTNPIKYVHNIVQSFALKKHNELIEQCTDCPINSYIKTIGYGSPNAQLLIIGDSTFSKDNTCFTEQEKEIFKQVLSNLNLNIEEVYFTNVINCYPYKEINKEKISRPPNKKEINNCTCFVNHLIEIIKPRAILLLGNIALNIFKESIIRKERGQWIDIKGIPTMVTYHPQSFINPRIDDEDITYSIQCDFFEDINKIKIFFKEKYPNSTFIKE